MSKLYIIGPQGGPYKIGLAADPAKRLEALQTGSHQDLILFDVAEVGDAYEAERRAHIRLAPFRARGEWFTCTLDAAKAAIRGPLPSDPPRNFKEWREGLGLSQRAAARALGMSKNTVANYERGRPMPLYVALACSAISYGVEPEGG